MSTFNQPQQQQQPPPQQQPQQQQQQQQQQHPPAHGSPMSAASGGYSLATQNYIQGLHFQGKTSLARWSTKLGQCSPPVTGNDWAFATFCTSCANATAKSEFDGSDPCFNYCCFCCIGNFAWIRRGYNLHGTCGDDCCQNCFCCCCTSRMALNEAREQHKNGTNPPLMHGGPPDWQESLFGCGCCDCIKACLCWGSIIKDIRRMLQPFNPKLQQDSCCFDCWCVLPTAMYGQVRHMYGIQNEFGLMEDLCVPVLCCPCALNRAKREARFRDAEIKKFLGNAR